MSEQDQHPWETSTTQRQPSSKEDELFCFDGSEENAYVSVENEVADYFKSGATGMDALNQFSLIKRGSLKYNAPTPSSAPVERLFSLGNLILSPKRNRLSDQKFQKLILLRYNNWFESYMLWLLVRGER